MPHVKLQDRQRERQWDKLHALIVGRLDVLGKSKQDFGEIIGMSECTGKNRLHHDLGSLTLDQLLAFGATAGLPIEEIRACIRYRD